MNPSSHTALFILLRVKNPLIRNFSLQISQFQLPSHFPHPPTINSQRKTQKHNWIASKSSPSISIPIPAQIKNGPFTSLNPITTPITNCDKPLFRPWRRQLKLIWPARTLRAYEVKPDVTTGRDATGSVPASDRRFLLSSAYLDVV